MSFWRWFFNPNTRMSLRAERCGKRISLPPAPGKNLPHGQGGPVLRVPVPTGAEPSGAAGSLTVEAALVLPLFLFFMMEILSVFNMIRLQSVIYAGLREAGTKAAEYAFYLRYGTEDLQNALPEGTELSLPDLTDPGVAGSLLLSETWVRQQTASYGGDLLESGSLQGGAAGICYIQSRIMTENDEIDLVADYRMNPVLPLFGIPGTPLQSRFVSHAWVGYGVPAEEAESEEETETVFITSHGSVYHRSRDCVYLNPSVTQVNAGEIPDLRSRDGSKYYACELCDPFPGGTLYITNEGNRYHGRTDCPGIKRSVTEVPLSSVEGRIPPCSKCGGGE